MIKIMDKVMRVMNLLKDTGPFFVRNTRYVLVVCIFALASFYSLRIAADIETNGNKKSDQEIESQAERIVDLDNDTREKLYVNEFDSQSGDYYRVIVRAQANQDASVAIYARSLLGIEKLLGEIMIDADNLAPYEQVFSTDDIYRDIILRRPVETDDKNISWDGAKIHISDVSVTRLDVASQVGATQLKPTIFGNTKVSFRYLPPTIPGKVDTSLMIGNRSIGEYFKPEASSIAAVYGKFSIVGNGGLGLYEVEVSEYDEQGLGRMKSVAKTVFEADKLWKYTDKENKGLYRFDMSVVLDKEKLYFVSFNSKDVVSDKENGLELVRFGEDEEGHGGSMIALGVVDYTQVGTGKSAAHILSGATIQDIGSAYLYEYQMSHTERDLLDISVSQEIPKYDNELKMITLSEADGAALSYRIDTVYPFAKMNARVKGIEAKKRGGFQVEYSLDGKNWQKVLAEDDVENRQEANFIIDGQGTTATAYIRIAHYGKAQKNDVLGLRDLQISALLKK